MSGRNWAYALGAAILQGNRSYQEALQLQRLLAQQGFDNNLRTQENARAQKASDLNTQVMQEKINELPKEHALSDVKNLIDFQGIRAFNNPALARAADTAGLPFERKPVPGVGPVEENVARDTGIVIPSQYMQAEGDRQRKIETDRMMSDWLKRTMGAGQPAARPQPAASTQGPQDVEPDRLDPQEVSAWQMNRVAGIPTIEPKETDAHKLWLQRQELTNRAAFKPPSAATEKERLAYAKVRELLPQFEQTLAGQVADPHDPTGQKMGVVGMVTQKAKALGQKFMYDEGLPLSDNDSISQQLAGALRVIGASPYMNGSRSMQMFNEAAVHVMDRAATPEAKLQRVNELKTIFPEFEQLMGVNAPALPANARPGAGAAPVAQPAAAPPIPPTSGTNVPTSGTPQAKTATVAEVNAYARARGISPKDAAQQLIQSGYRIQ